MIEPSGTIRPIDAEACHLARRLIAEARHGALAVTDPARGGPYVSRVAVGHLAGPGMVLLVSELSVHTRAMRTDPAVALLLGGPGPRGDPLSQPRLTLAARAQFVSAEAAATGNLRALWLKLHPKARLYVDFPDFCFVRLAPLHADLNAGFGKAYALRPDDIAI